MSCFVLNAPYTSVSTTANAPATATENSAMEGFSVPTLAPECPVINTSNDAGVVVGQTAESVWLGEAFNVADTERARQFPSLRYAFSESVTSFGPNDFFVMQKSLEDDMDDIPLRTVISLLKLSGWDSDIFFKFRMTILNQSASCNTKLLKDLCRGMPLIWTNNYFLETDKDIAFEIGRFYYGIKDYQNALQFYNFSIQFAGDHHITRHNQGLCYYNLGDLKTALTAFKSAATMDPSYDKARSWIDKIVREKRGPLPLPPSPRATSAAYVDTNALVVDSGTVGSISGGGGGIHCSDNGDLNSLQQSVVVPVGVEDNSLVSPTLTPSMFADVETLCVSTTSTATTGIVNATAMA